MQHQWFSSRTKWTQFGRCSTGVYPVSSRTNIKTYPHLLGKAAERKKKKEQEKNKAA